MHVVVTVKVELAFSPEGTETLVGFKCGVIPVLGEAVAVRLTVPENPLMLATVMIAEPQPNRFSFFSSSSLGYLYHRAPPRRSL